MNPIQRLLFHSVALLLILNLKTTHKSLFFPFLLNAELNLRRREVTMQEKCEMGKIYNTKYKYIMNTCIDLHIIWYDVLFAFQM